MPSKNTKEVRTWQKMFKTKNTNLYKKEKLYEDYVR